MKDDSPETLRPAGFPRTKEAALRTQMALIAEELDTLREKVDNPIALIQAIGKIEARMSDLESSVDGMLDSERSGHKETQKMLGQLFSELKDDRQDQETFKTYVREQIALLKKASQNGHAST